MGAYYNENDVSAAAWLRSLIGNGSITPGDVDERSIVDVRPDDLKGYAQCHFFAGIGGWSYALRLAGWPDDRPVWTGSCPCQPLSGAGQQKGHADERHLWPAFYRLIAECAPATVFGEQVASKLGREWLAGVRADLEALGYAVGGADLCSAGTSAPHIRQRLYWLADADGRQSGDGGLQPGRQYRQQPQDGCIGGMADSDVDRAQCLSRDDGQALGIPEEERPEHSATLLERSGAIGGLENADGQGPAWHPFGQLGASADPWSTYEVLPCTDGKARRIEPGSFPLAHGVPGRVGLLRGYGNAICPQVAAAFIGAAMKAVGLNEVEEQVRRPSYGRATSP